MVIIIDNVYDFATSELYRPVFDQSVQLLNKYFKYIYIVKKYTWEFKESIIRDSLIILCISCTEDCIPPNIREHKIIPLIPPIISLSKLAKRYVRMLNIPTINKPSFLIEYRRRLAPAAVYYNREANVLYIFMPLILDIRYLLKVVAIAITMLYDYIFARDNDLFYYGLSKLIETYSMAANNISINCYCKYRNDLNDILVNLRVTHDRIEVVIPKLKIKILGYASQYYNKLYDVPNNYYLMLYGAKFVFNVNGKLVESYVGRQEILENDDYRDDLKHDNIQYIENSGICLGESELRINLRNELCSEVTSFINKVVSMLAYPNAENNFTHDEYTNISEVLMKIAKTHGYKTNEKIWVVE